MRRLIPALGLALFLIACGSAARAQASVTLDAKDLRQVGSLGWVAPGLKVPPPNPALPMINPKSEDPGATFLRSLAARRLAAGFSGVLYDNRDRGHSTLPDNAFPTLAWLTYGPELRKAGLDYGLGGAILMPAVVLGNSSTALGEGNRVPRSLPRLAMTAEGWPARSFRSYVSNQVYVYPEHRDHDDVDLFPANWPYMVTSQGSSSSDQAFLRALALTLAAFQPETRARLETEGLIAPTLQMILRRGMVPSREAYFTGAAHPAAFDGARLVPERMVGLAAAMTPDTIPAMVRLGVESETFSTSAGLAGLSEHLFDTPSAIARVWRGPAWSREMVISVAQTRDPNGRDLRFRWVLLQGDAERVRIEPLDAAGTRARLTIDWHEAPPPVGKAGLTARRVDIGVFASNGAQDSAPAFVSVSFPAHELRRYEAGPDGTMRLVSVDYDARGRKTYYDPLVHWSAPWRDSYAYDESGGIVDVQREGTDGKTRYDMSDPAALIYHLDRAKKGRSILRVETTLVSPTKVPTGQSDLPAEAGSN
jgi:hypothetical protein